jgi:formate/nitrite transporter
MSTPVVRADCYAPGEVAGIACNASKAKASSSLGKLIVLGLLAGAYIGFGACLATTLGHDVPKYLGNGIGQLVFGSAFSVGLMLVVIGGAELFTGNNMFMMVGALEGTSTWRSLLKNWAVVWVANLVGALVLVLIVYGAFYTGDSAGLFKGGVGAKALNVAKAKVELGWWAALLRGILCNWLVCLAVWLALASKDVVGKIFGIFFPIMAFVAMGFEHSVANMFFIPMGLMVKGNQAIVDLAASGVLTADQLATLASGGQLPEAATAAMDAFRAGVSDHLTWGAFFYRNLIPVTIGNIIGGGVFVGTSYWYAYLRRPKTAVARAEKVKDETAE